MSWSLEGPGSTHVFFLHRPPFFQDPVGLPRCLIRSAASRVAKENCLTSQLEFPPLPGLGRSGQLSLASGLCLAGGKSGSRGPQIPEMHHASPALTLTNTVGSSPPRWYTFSFWLFLLQMRCKHVELVGKKIGSQELVLGFSTGERKSILYSYINIDWDKIRHKLILRLEKKCLYMEMQSKVAQNGKTVIIASVVA